MRRPRAAVPCYQAAEQLARELAARGLLFDGSPWSPCGHPGRCADDCADDVGPGRVRIRIGGSNARIHLNDGVLEGPDHAVSRNLRRLLNALGAQPAVNVPRLGDRALAARPRAGFAGVFDLLAHWNFAPGAVFDVGVFNLADRKHWDAADVPSGTLASSAVLDRYTSSGRNVGVSLAVSW